MIEALAERRLESAERRGQPAARRERRAAAAEMIVDRHHHLAPLLRRLILDDDGVALDANRRPLRGAGRGQQADEQEAGAAPQRETVIRI